MKLAARSSATLATAAATLLLAGAAFAPSATAAEETKGHCVGANACKGQGACKTATNACKGQNACKGHGFMSTTKAECDKIPGAKFEEVKG